MKLIKHYDVVSMGKVIETVLADSTADATASALINKHADKPGVSVESRFVEPEMVVVSEPCEGGNCPVKVAPAESAQGQAALAPSGDVTSAPVVQGVQNPVQ